MTSEVEGAVERLTEVMNDAIADHEDDVARAWEDGERPDLWDAPDVTVSIPDLRRVLAALRAQVERVRVLEGERDDTLVRWCARMAEIREASGVGMKPMLDEVPGAIAERIAAAEARAEAAERRAGELEGALKGAEATLALVEHPAREDPLHGSEVRALGARIGYGALMSSAQASWRMHLEESGYPLGGEHVAGPSFGTVQVTLRAIRAALLPATQAENPQEHDDE